MNKKLGLRRFAGLTGSRRRYVGLTAFVTCIAAAMFVVPAAFASGNAGYTTFDATIGGCLDSPNGVDCNNYASKGDVFMNGGPSNGSGLNDGSYYFTVVVPGFQNGGFVQGAAGNLSDDVQSNDSKSDPTQLGAGSGDLIANRTFTVSTVGGNKVITYTGADATHATGTSPNGHFIVQLANYDDTTNAGGVYILAVCEVGATSASQCKFDAFRINTPLCTHDCGTDVASDLSASKTVAGAYTTTYTWGISKSTTATSPVRTSNTSVSITYTVQVTHDGGTNSNVGVSGTITITNPNQDAVQIDGITDTLSDNTTCSVTGGGSQSIPHGDSTFAYSCSLGALPSSSLTNKVTVSWSTQFLTDDGVLAGNDASFTSADITFGQTLAHNCTTVTDPNPSGGTSSDNPFPTTVCVGQAGPPADGGAGTTTGKGFTFTYHVSYTVNPNTCVKYTNTATESTNGNTSSVDVTICPTVNGLTIGYWSNKNGQARISGGASTLGVCNSATSLRQYAPFQDLSATATCAQVATYVSTVIKAANASGAAMNAMLKAQMLATALNVFFGVTNGNEHIDLAHVCKMIDGSGGTATCSGTYQNVSAAFGGATDLTVLQILSYAASQSNVGGSIWYGQVKATQELAKNTFDAINNGVALSI